MDGTFQRQRCVVRSGGPRLHPYVGNVQFRDLVASRVHDYFSYTTSRHEKALIVASIVRQIREMQPSGGFLKKDADGSWFDIGAYGSGFGEQTVTSSS